MGTDGVDFNELIDFTSFLTAKLVVASLSKKLNNLVKSTKTKLTEHSEETEERGL